MEMSNESPRAGVDSPMITQLSGGKSPDPTLGSKFLFLTTYHLKWVDFVREIMSKPREYDLSYSGEMILL